MQIEENVPLATYTTFGIGGSARFFIRIQSLLDIQKALLFAKEKKLSLLFLGGGSNMLVSDAGFDGLVLKIELPGIELRKALDTNQILLVAGGGESWDQVVGRAVEENLWGLENLSGIPGTVGGGVVQNIGAYGAALSQTLAWAEVFDCEHAALYTFTHDVCEFDYRDSIFKRNDRRYIILQAAFNLSLGAKPDISYKDLAQQLTPESGLLAIRQAVLNIRKGKFPDLSHEGTAGSYFKNPIISGRDIEEFRLRYPDMPLFLLPETKGAKVPLAWLLDHVLQLHGKSIGGARLFERQPLVIVAQKNTSSNDVRALADFVVQRVRDVCGINIETEVKII